MSVPRETVAVVLGCPTGSETQPMPLARARAETAAALYRANIVDRVLVVGGRGHPATGTEGAVISRWIELAGVPRNRIETEHESRNTWENARAARRTLGARARVIVVTQGFHSKRATLYFRWWDLAANVWPAPTPVSGRRRRSLVLREVLSWGLMPLQILQDGWKLR